jgi:hypothetical protein
MFIYKLGEKYDWINFKEAKPLIDFINLNKAQIINQSIKGIYCTSSPLFSNGRKSAWMDTPLILIISNYEIVIDYMFYSDLSIMIKPLQNSVSEYEKEYEYGSLLANCKPYWNAPENLEIEDIEVTRFDSEFEINPSTGKTRPKGGDYFSVIALRLKDNKKLCICAQDSMSDGYMDIWVTKEE